MLHETIKDAIGWRIIQLNGLIKEQEDAIYKGLEASNLTQKLSLEIKELLIQAPECVDAFNEKYLA